MEAHEQVPMSHHSYTPFVIPTELASSSSSSAPQWRILIDDREKFKDMFLNQFRAMGVKAEIAHLKTGDFWGVYGTGPDEKTFMIVERKSDPDMSGSIPGGRYIDQSSRLMQEFQDVPWVGYIRVLEKSTDEERTNAVENAYAHLSTTNLRLLMASKEKQVPKRLVYLLKHYKGLVEKGHDTFSAPTLEATLMRGAKKKAKDPKDVWIQQLMCVEGVSADKAQSIAEKYGDVRTFIRALDESSTPDAICLGLGTGKRKIGQEVSKRVRRAF